MRLVKSVAVGVGTCVLLLLALLIGGAGRGASPRSAFAQNKPGPTASATTSPPGGSSAAASAAPAASAAASAKPAASGSAAAGASAAPVGSTAPTTGGAGVAAAPTAAATAAAATAAAPGVDGPTYAVRLRDLEQRIDELKEQIRRSHTRLSLLSDTILSGGGAGSRSNIKFANELSSAFRVTRLMIVLDGAVQYNKTDNTGALAEQAEIPVFNGSIPPGDHTLQVLLNLQGNGYGVFSYLRSYNFEVKASHSFTAAEGKTISLSVVAHEKGGVTTKLEDRPAVRFAEKVQSGLAEGAARPATK
ncbi:MAG: hypothetical protein WKG00_06255 [Polyangiaceae bacterium]